ncbi:4-(cytidine 5'-diphospho)-2-C-methyl-D-erythritol kinase [Hephaestia mangrovi]|uniref:4-(cytidine 5'-diphospho)-2-C-methyl-D-erythritol kinase n=1 Tax=Hephaestia mangrovi TaxID=2873268 RepID=UPI001CA796E9|nr:4-(cytidine 5'-diphospho)-2-C-methyl-D-erythritol kinase [Hephaestia mangrovi]MBY8827803.1 4-(cytidine 5'-diphospho)-2-C-methyl-D-erythritol kinase [Hephaestia mangrovi]
MGSVPALSTIDVTAIVEPAPAKINLALHVRRRREDGYHEIETLFAFLRDGDLLTVADADSDSFAVIGPYAAALAGEGTNLVMAARDAFARAFGAIAPLAITLDKRLPVASGIGGGSADAAALLRVLARRHGVTLDDPRLLDCAASLGADIPACLLGRAAFGTGIGTDLQATESLVDTPVLLVNPGVAVSTAAVFRAWNGSDLGPLGGADPLAAARAGRNDLEPAALALAPVIGIVLSALAAAPGVLLSRMSGSGATCFALFEDRQACAAAATALRAAHPDWWQLESTLA